MDVHEIIGNYKKNPLILTETKDQFYEGTYLNHVKWNPDKRNFFSKCVTFFLSNGYLHQIDYTFKKGSILLELGCAGGWDYLGVDYKMIGLDISEKSIKQGSEFYDKIVCDACNLDINSGQFDGVVSSYFWEHINLESKKKILYELHRILKKEGKGVFLFDVKTANKLIKAINKEFYQKEFILKDGHIGYHTIKTNIELLEECGFVVDNVIGMERGIFQSRSVYDKLSKHEGFLGVFGKALSGLFGGKIGLVLNILMVRCLDIFLSKMLNINKSRIVILRFSKR